MTSSVTLIGVLTPASARICLALAGIVAVRVVVERARETGRPERLVDLHLALEEAVGHALVVDQVAGGFPHGFRLQRRGLLVEAQEVHGGLRIGLDLDRVLAGEAGDLVRRQVLGHVDVARFQQQLLGRGLGDMADDDALDRRRAEEIVRVGFEVDDFGRAERFQDERTGAGRIGLEPGIAHVAIGLVGLHGDGVDHRSRARGQHVEHEGRREVAGIFDDDLVAVGLDHRLDVLRASSRAGSG